MTKIRFFKNYRSDSQDIFSNLPIEIMGKLLEFLTDLDILRFARLNTRIFLVVTNHFPKYLLKACLTKALDSMLVSFCGDRKQIMALKQEVTCRNLAEISNISALIKKFAELKAEVNDQKIKTFCEQLKLRSMRDLDIEQTLELNSLMQST